MPQGKSAELRKSCQSSLKNETWHRSSILDLVEGGLCPSYLLPSTTFNGLCVPQFALATPEKATNMSLIMERIQVSSSQMLDPKKVLGGSKFALEKLVIKGFWEKSLQSFVTAKPLLFFTMLLAISIFLINVISSLRLYIVPVNIIVSFIVLFYCLVFSFCKHLDLENYFAALHTELQNTFVNYTNRDFWPLLGVSALILILVLLVSVFFNFCAKCMCPLYQCTKDRQGVVGKPTTTIERTIRRILLVKPVLLVPTIGLLVKCLVILLTINSSCLLASPSAKEFRVVGACLEELCINNNTNKFYREGDLCIPDHFK